MPIDTRSYLVRYNLILSDPFFPLLHEFMRNFYYRNISSSRVDQTKTRWNPGGRRRILCNNSEENVTDNLQECFFTSLETLARKNRQNRYRNASDYESREIEVLWAFLNLICFEALREKLNLAFSWGRRTFGSFTIFPSIFYQRPYISQRILMNHTCVYVPREVTEQKAQTLRTNFKILINHRIYRNGICPMTRNIRADWKNKRTQICYWNKCFPYRLISERAVTYFRKTIHLFYLRIGNLENSWLSIKSKNLWKKWLLKFGFAIESLWNIRGKKNVLRGEINIGQNSKRTKIYVSEMQNKKNEEGRGQGNNTECMHQQSLAFYDRVRGRPRFVGTRTLEYAWIRKCSETFE